MNKISLIFSFLLGLYIIFTSPAYYIHFQIWWPRFLAFFLAIVMFVAIYAIGKVILNIFFPYSIDKKFVRITALPIGFGTMIFSIFLLDKFNLFSISSFVVLLLSIDVLLVRIYYKKRKVFYFLLKRFLKNKKINFELLIFILIGFLVISVDFLHIFLPPLDYDVLEYHLGTPSRYFIANKIYFIKECIYANFPQGMELIAYAFMKITGSKIIGAMSAKGFQFLLFLYLLGMMYKITEEFFKGTGWYTILMIIAFPATSEYLRKFYVELPMIAIILPSIWIFLNRRQKIHFFIAGICIGVAANIKYNALFLIFPAIIGWGYFTRIITLQGIMYTILGVVIGYLPTGIRNFINTYDPFYPLSYAFFQIENPFFDVYKFVYAHSMKQPFFSIMKDIYRGLFANIHIASFYSLIGFFALITSCQKKWKSIGIISIIITILWLGTHRIDRFLYPAIIVLLISSGYIYRLLPKVAKILFIFFLWVSIYHNITITPLNTYNYIFGFKSFKEFVISQYPAFNAQDFINNKITKKDKKKVLVIGESRIFYFDVPVVYSSVFDYNFIEKNLHLYSLPEFYHFLKERGIWYIYIDWKEFQRLAKTYSYFCNGKKYNGYMNNISSYKFYTFLNSFCKKIYQNKICNYVEIYKLKEFPISSSKVSSKSCIELDI